MRLKSLEVIGFKSFVDRTVVHFDDGITGIVGPNGCGKSNVVDAIRWVMGEQSAKHLRGSEMSDVIFNGSDARPQMGMASVTLTFDNSDGKAPPEYAAYSEISVGRRLYRSGESEYFINKVPCRLKDIIELFLGTGIGAKAYSIVEQEQIGKIVSAKPEELRQLLEEAAGISKFKMRKEAALRKIEATKQNLARLTDIISELERQKNSLSRQARKAERFKELSDELKGLELSLSAHKYREFAKELESLKTRLNELSEEEAGKSAKLSNEETTIDNIKIELTEVERELNEVQEKVYEFQNKLKLTEAEIRFKTDQLADRKQRLTDSANKIEELKLKKIDEERNLDNLNQAKLTADIDLASAEEAVSTIQGKASGLKTRQEELTRNIESIRNELMDCLKVSTESKAKMEQLEKSEIDLSGKIAKNQTEIDAIDGKISNLETQMLSMKDGLSEMDSKKTNLSLDLNSLSEEISKLKSDLLHNETSLKELNQHLSTKKSRLSSLEEIQRNFEGYQDGVRAIMKRKSEMTASEGILGTIGEIAETDPAYETAVSAVLGEKLQYVVVKSHQEGVEAVEYLKAQATGRSTFVPLELKASETEVAYPSGEGIIGPMMNYVSFPDDYKRIGNYLLGDVVLVEDLKKALNIWQTNGHKKTLVTLDGEVVDPYGAVTGGKSGDVSKQFFSQKREISDLKGEVARLSQEVSAREKTVGDIHDRLQVNENRAQQLKSTIHTHEVESVHKERDITGIAQDLDNWRRNRDRLTVEVAAFAEELKKGAEEKARLASELEALSLKKTELESSSSSLSSESETIKTDLNNVTEELTSLKVTLAAKQEQSTNLEREISRVIADVSEIDSNISKEINDINDGNEEIASNEKAVEQAKLETEKLVQDISLLTAKQTELNAKYEESTKMLHEKEVGLRELRKSLEETRNMLHEIQLSETKASERLFHLERDVLDKYHFDLPTRHEEYKITVEENEEILAAVERVSIRVTELKERLEKMGSVNSDAITEYEGVANRFEFLSKQCADLNTSLDTLQKTILKINRTSKERFVETFAAVNDRFKTLFPKLFRGGKAELVMLDQENILESGIDIIVQPPGKKLQSVTLLSGGEKALTAVSLIFSIFLIKPSPFCLLDEADAPLDDANIDRFNDIVREMSKLSQFIVITHNKRTMELADTLYGVTMEEAGVSKILSVKLEHVDKIQKAA